MAISGEMCACCRVETAAGDFHARYSALEKTYVYRIVNGPVISPFWWRYAHHDARPLDLERMKDVARSCFVASTIGLRSRQRSQMLKIVFGL